MRHVFRSVIIGCIIEIVLVRAHASAQAVSPAPADSAAIAGAEEGTEAPKDEAADAEKSDARDHFRRGVELYQEGAHRAALVEFERAYELSPDFRVLYNIAQAKLALQDYLGATQSFDRYLQEGGKSIPVARRNEVESNLAALQDRIARLVINVNKSGADVFVDDVKVGVSPLRSVVLVNVGRHRVSGLATGGATGHTMVAVAGGDLEEVSLELVAANQTVIIASEKKPPLSQSRKLAIAAWVTGGAALIGGGVTGYFTSDAVSSLQKERDTVPTTRKKLNEERDSARTLEITTGVLAGTGLALVATGAVLWLMGGDGKRDSGPSQPSKAQEARIRWGIGYGTIFARGEF